MDTNFMEKLSVADLGRLLSMKGSIETLSEEMKKVNVALAERKGIDNGFQIHLDNINKFIDSADKKFASKLSEKITYGMVTIIVLTVLGAVLSGVVSRTTAKAPASIVSRPN